MGPVTLTIRPGAISHPPMMGSLGIDWSGCSLVEQVPGKVSGVPILKHTRLQADAIVENYESGSPIDEISDNFSISEEIIRQVLAYAESQRPLHVA